MSKRRLKPILKIHDDNSIVFAPRADESERIAAQERKVEAARKHLADAENRLANAEEYLEALMEFRRVRLVYEAGLRDLRLV